MISMLHSVYWRWLQDWLLILNMQHELEPSDQSKMDLLTHLLMHSSKDVTNNLLRTLTTKIQEHQVTYHRYYSLSHCNTCATDSRLVVTIIVLIGITVW